MTITYRHNIGDTTEIKPYQIFKNPTPIEWNEDPYGYGEEWYPGDELTITGKFDLYAQYEPAYITYYLTSYIDGRFETQHVAYANQIGARVEIADFPGISNFRVWVDAAGNHISIGSFVYLTSSIDLYMSCDTTYVMQFDGNGHPNLDLHNISAIQHTYVDYKTGECINASANIVLPVVDYQFGGLISKCWRIGQREYSFGSAYTLTSDAVARLVWRDAIQYTLACECRLMNTAYAFRYCMLKIDSAQNLLMPVKISSLQFCSTDGKSVFEPPDSYSYKTYNVKSYVSQTPKQLLDAGSIAAEFAFYASRLPIGIQFDFKSSVLNLSKYGVFKLYVPSDCNISVCMLYVSNDGETWFQAAELDISQSGVNPVLKPVRVSGSGQTFNFNGSSQNEDILVECAKGNGGYIDTGYKPTSSTAIEFEICINGQYADQPHIGVDPLENSSTGQFCFFVPDSNICKFQAFGVNWQNLLSSNLAFGLGDWRVVKCSLKNGISFGSGDQQALPDMPNMLAGEIQANQPVCLFGNNSNPVNVSLKYFKAYEETDSGKLELKMHLRPALDKANRACLIDQISNQKFYSANSTDIMCYS